MELPDCWDGHIFPKPLETRGYSRYIPLDIQGHRNSVSAYSWTPKIYQSKMWKRHIHHLPTLQKSSLRWVMNWNTWAIPVGDIPLDIFWLVFIGIPKNKKGVWNNPYISLGGISSQKNEPTRVKWSLLLWKCLAWPFPLGLSSDEMIHWVVRVVPLPRIPVTTRMTLYF